MTDNEKPTADKPDAKEEKAPTVADLKSMAADYHVPMSEDTLKHIIAEGLDESKVEAFKEFLKMTSAGQFPTLAKMIMAGFKTGHLLTPYAETKKIMLGDHATFDPIGNPADAQALHGGRTPDGNPTPMSLSEWQNSIKGDPSHGWQHTPAAHEESQKIIQALHAGMAGGEQ